MNESLKYVNAMIGFCIPSGGGWPSPFQHLNYEVRGVEHPVEIIAGDSIKLPTPEIIVSSSQTNHAFLLEAKSRTVTIHQAQHYALIDSQMLRDQGLYPDGSIATDVCHDVIYICRPDNTVQVATGLGDAGVHFPVIAADDRIFVLGVGHLSEPLFDQTFREGIEVDGLEWPSKYVRVTASCDPSDLVRPLIHILNTMMVQALHSEEARSTSAFAVSKRTIEHWDWCGEEEQNRFVNKVNQLLVDASIAELKNYLTRTPGRRRERLWHLNPPAFEYPSSADKYAAAAEAFVHRVERGLPYQPLQHRLVMSGVDIDEAIDP